MGGTGKANQGHIRQGAVQCKATGVMCSVSCEVDSGYHDGSGDTGKTESTYGPL